MASASKKTASIIAVILGCIGAGWLVYCGIIDFISFIAGFSFTTILKYIFSTGLMCLATLMLGITFFVTIIKDLNIIKKGVSIFSLVVSTIVFVCYMIRIIGGWPFNLLHPNFWSYVATAFLLLGYIMFFVYKMGMSNCKNFAWVVSLIGIVTLLVVSFWFLYNGNYNVGLFFHKLFGLLAHTAVFFCGLKKY